MNWLKNCRSVKLHLYLQTCVIGIAETEYITIAFVLQQLLEGDLKMGQQTWKIQIFFSQYTPNLSIIRNVPLILWTHTCTRDFWVCPASLRELRVLVLFFLVSSLVPFQSCRPIASARLSQCADLQIVTFVNNQIQSMQKCSFLSFFFK